MILKFASHDTEEFRRVALRRRSKRAAAAADHAPHTVPPKPIHLQTPEKAPQQKNLAPPPDKRTCVASRCPTWDGPQNGSHRSQVGSELLQVTPAQNPIASKSPGVNRTCVSPVLSSDGTKLLRTPSPSPAPRGAWNGSPLRGGRGGPGGRSGPTSLSPGDVAQRKGIRRTPSPKLWRTWSYCHTQRRTGNPRMDEVAGHSGKVPQLLYHLDRSSPTFDPSERPPLQPLPSANCTTTTTSTDSTPTTSRSPACKRLHRTTSAGVLSLEPGGTSMEPLPGPVAPAGPEQSPEGAHSGGEPQEAGTGEGGSPPASGKHTMTLEEEGMHEEVDQRVEKEDKEQEDEEEHDDDVEGGRSKREKKLYNIATELLTSERAYVARLHLLDQVFCSRLSEEALRGSFPVDVVKNIFSNIASIHSFHSQFLLPDLEERMKHWWVRPGLGDILLHHAPFLRMYAEYVGNFEQATGLLRSWRERSAAFRAVLQDVQSQKVCGSLGLAHHMLEPVQRVPRYEMLLKHYLRNLPEEDPDRPLAHKALEAISMAAVHSNSAIHRAESLKKLLEIFEMVGEEEILRPSSELLREGRLLKLAARNASAMDRYLFLFNNFLLCCTPKLSLVGQRYGVRTRIGVEGMQVQRTANEDHPYSFQISGKEKTLELEARLSRKPSTCSRRKNESFKLASKKFEEAELGRRAPRWIRDNEVEECMACGEAFNAITRRRHHCRACGCVVCWKCSEHKVALAYDGNRANKEVSSPLASIPLLGTSVEESPRLPAELQDPGRFCLVRHTPAAAAATSGSSSVRHTFLCDGPELKQRWLVALRRAGAADTNPDPRSLS
ncbi:hypothetical protein CRUP_013826 [Coryphaenoides rupestris]|nr:hypothetical protein CRUP_013826 [Coryphaenoides rupestris]